jgi:hypothetical protein
MSATNNFTFHIYVNNGTMKVAPQKIPFQQINTLLTLTNTKVGTSNLTAQVYDAALLFGGIIDWSPAKGIKYYGEGSLTDMNMKKFADTFVADPADRQLVSGAGDLRAKFSGNTATPSLSKTFAAIGDVDIRHGHFFVIPVLKNVLRKTKHADAATVGEAAATFDISNRNIDFPSIAASSPLVGVQGNGRISFDDDIDMTLAVTPLANWRKNVQDTGIPIFSDLFGYLAGDAQDANNEIVREGIDQFRVTGQASNPQIEQVPVPILNDTVRSLFHFMSFAKAEDAISKELRRRQQTESTTQQSQP